MNSSPNLCWNIFTSIREGNIERVKEILSEHPDSVHWVEKRLNRTGLMVAVVEGNPKIVALFLKSGADIYAQEWAGGSPIGIAAGLGPEKSAVRVVKELLKKPHDLNNLELHGGRLPLWKAAQSHGNEEIVNLLIDHGANPNLLGTTRESEPLYRMWDKSHEEDGMSDMMKCLHEGKSRWEATRLNQATPRVSRNRPATRL